MKKNKLLSSIIFKLTLLYVFTIISIKTYSQIKIGDNPKSLNKDAILEMESIDKGLLLPRIALSSITSPQPLSNFTNGMIVYNISLKNNLSPGIYYSDGTKWIRAINNNNTPNNFINGIKYSTDTVAVNDQMIFKTPDTITDINKIFLYRNGILIFFIMNDNKSIISELPCKKGDQIRIIQLL